jgi:hypothetical protein
MEETSLSLSLPLIPSRQGMGSFLGGAIATINLNGFNLFKISPGVYPEQY